MTRARVLIVEDERIIAEDIKKSLQSLNYAVTAIAATGEEAVRKAEQHQPDIVLMDILLAGAMSGIEAARQIRTQFNTPIIFLTANANAAMVEQAKKAEPYGYLLKPFHDKELESTIETALYKHTIEQRLRESEAWLATTMQSMGCGVVAADNDGKVTFMNQMAAAVTGWEAAQGMGQPLVQVLD